VHKVDAPDLVGALWLKECLFDPCRQTLFASSADVESHGRVDPVNTLKIPTKAFDSHPVMTLPNPDRRMLLNQCGEFLDNR